jgi:hypothetical protein
MFVSREELCFRYTQDGSSCREYHHEATLGSNQSMVGKCIMCSTLHDDYYDNGHAPCEGREASCCRCRVLVLVCNTCRANVRCWGEPEGKTELFCGHSCKGCVEEKVILPKTLRQKCFSCRLSSQQSTSIVSVKDSRDCEKSTLKVVLRSQ